MSLWRLIWRTLAYHWRIQCAVALGVAAATAVLTGALVVGDSVRGSLQHLALDRLGRIDQALVADHTFRTALADDLQNQPGFRAEFATALPAWVLQGSLSKPDPRHPARAGKVTILGCGNFAALGPGGPAQPVAAGDIVLNAPLAEHLQAQVGQEVILRVGQFDQIPADSPLGRKSERVRNRRLTVRQIVPAEGLGRFGLHPSQQLPRVAFVAPETLATALAVGDQCNAIFLLGGPSSGGPSSGGAAGAQADAALAKDFHPHLADYGFSFVHAERGYWQFVSDRLIIAPPAERAVLEQLAAERPQPVLSYLANTIQVGDRSIPYSTVAALDFATEPPLGPFLDRQGQPVPPLADGDIALNDWAADDLAAKVGDTVELVYFEPESTHGQVREKTVSLRLAAILPLAGAAADRQLTPEMPGITDQKSIADWDPPFPFQADRVRKKDEQYWDQYRATPKGFVSLATGRKLWASRFGQATSIRLAAAADNATADSLAGKLRLDPDALGFRFLPVRRLALAAATGTTPFSVLFLSFSFFIIAAAVMLVAILFQLGVDQRAAEIGLLAAIGLPPRRIVGLLAAEGLLVAAVGAALGIAAGWGYAWLMLAGLRTWWLEAISTPFLQLHVAPASLLIGYFSGLIVSAATIFWTARRLRKLPATSLLAGQVAPALGLARPGAFRWTTRIAWASCASAILLGLAATRMGGEAQAGSFFTAGMLVLSGLLMLLFVRLRVGAARATAATVPRTLGALAVRNGSRNPRRSTLSVGLVAAATFLIVATGAFRLDPAAEGHGRQSGQGGFNLVAQSDQPIFRDLGTSAGRSDLGFSQPSEDLLAKGQIFELRLRPGDDASCLNLYQPTQPAILGAPAGLIERGGFSWAQSAAVTPAEQANPWTLLEPASAAGSTEATVPVLLDMNTALYSLHLYQGVGAKFSVTDERGHPLQLQVVGLLQNSLLQGYVVMSEQNLLAHFPGASGYRYFLIDMPEGQVAAARQAFDETLEDYGFDARPAVELLANFMAVQNTYLSTFQSLGGLGLLLGTVGLAIVELRSVLERRGELALMQAVGFRRRRLAAMVLWENALLLLAGLAIGLAAALVAVLPHLAGSGAALGWSGLLGTLALVLAVGLLAGLLAARSVLRADLLPALRAE